MLKYYTVFVHLRSRKINICKASVLALLFDFIRTFFNLQMLPSSSLIKGLPFRCIFVEAINVFCMLVTMSPIAIVLEAIAAFNSARTYCVVRLRISASGMRRTVKTGPSSTELTLPHSRGPAASPSSHAA